MDHGLVSNFASSLLNSKFTLLSNNRLEINFLTCGFCNSSVLKCYAFVYVPKFMFNLQV